MQVDFWRANAQYFFAECVAAIMKKRKVGEGNKFLPRGWSIGERKEGEGEGEGEGKHLS